MISFIRIPKTGSSAVYEATDRKQVFSLVHKPHSHYLPMNQPSFTIIRNPWVRLHSWWRYQKYCDRIHFRDYVLTEALTEYHTDNNRDYTTLRVADQYAWLKNANNEYPTRIAQYEHLAADMVFVARDLKFELKPLGQVNLSPRAKPWPYSPRVWGRDMCEHVAPLFEPFAEEFGYRGP